MDDKDDVVVWLFLLSAVAITLGGIVLGLHLTDSPPSLFIPGLFFLGLGPCGLLIARKINRKKMKKS